MPLAPDRKSDIIKDFQRDENDTGSPEVQIAVLTAHGLLHLCGLDHEDGAKEARRMAELELSILHAAGVPVLAALIGRTLGQP